MRPPDAVPDPEAGRASGAARAEFASVDREVLVELAPVLRRCVDLEPQSLARVRLRDARAAVLVRLPFGVLVSRTIAAPPRPDPLDVVVRCAEAVGWVDGVATAPVARDHEWRSGLPPDKDWHRLDTVPDDVVRSLVRQGAMALKDAATREGVPSAQPRAEVADALLDSIVLTVDDGAATSAPITLRALSALTRMGFLPRGGAVHIDARGRWIRVVAGYGTVYLERPGSGLTVR